MKAGIAAAAATALALLAPATAMAVQAQDGTVESVANGEEATIVYHLFLPDGASAERPVPVVLQTHGWGGTGDTDIDDENGFIKAGYGVLTWDQRGFGSSGGKVHIDSPQYEGQDVMRLIDMLAADPRVAQEAAGDPRIGMSGGSYAGASSSSPPRSTSESTRSRPRSPGTTSPTRLLRTVLSSCSGRCCSTRLAPPRPMARTRATTSASTAHSPRALRMACGRRPRTSSSSRAAPRPYSRRSRRPRSSSRRPPTRSSHRARHRTTSRRSGSSATRA